MENNNQHRRNFIKAAAIGSVAGISLLSACKEDEDEDQKVSPPEDLMQEHGLLNRILLIYDHCRVLLMANQSFPIEALANSAGCPRRAAKDLPYRTDDSRSPHCPIRR